MRFRATATIIWNIESENNYEKACDLVKSQLEKIQLNESLIDCEAFFQLDVLKNKVEKIQLGECEIHEVLDHITNDLTKKTYVFEDSSYNVKMNSDRYHVFKNNLTCCACGLEIKKVFLECYELDRAPHFNFYGEEENKLILFTKDHIQAKAVGGQDCLSNYQTMCSICNSLKAHSNLSLESVNKLRQMVKINRKKTTKKKLHTMIEQERINLEKPWPHMIYNSSKNSEYDVQIESDLFIIEKEKQLYSCPLNEFVEGQVKCGMIVKGSFLKNVIEINDNVACELPNGKMVYIAKFNIKATK
jgi:hypothetical protein